MSGGFLWEHRDPLYSWMLYVVGQWADHWMRGMPRPGVKIEARIYQAYLVPERD